MNILDFNDLYNKAKSIAKPQKLSDVVEIGGVGAALLTDKGNVYEIIMQFYSKKHIKVRYCCICMTIAV